MSRPLSIPQPENPLHVSWFDSNWIPFLNASNVMDYFSDKSNSFYDRTCNNEIVKMQRQSMEQLKNMNGVEYILLHVKEPILYVIRKQHRHSPDETTPQADFYIIAGKVYQAPDLASVFNSRILSTVHNLQQAFDDASSFARFHATKGYSWDFSAGKAGEMIFGFSLRLDLTGILLLVADEKEVNKEKPKEEPSSLFQRQRVDMLLGELLRKFPIPQAVPQEQANKPEEEKSAGSNKNDPKADAPVTIKQEPMDTNTNEHSVNSQTQIKQEPSSGPPEKKLKLNN